MDRQCSNCFHWKRQDENVGFCRKNPPVPVLMQSVTKLGQVSAELKGLFPPVHHSESCGEFTGVKNDELVQ